MALLERIKEILRFSGLTVRAFSIKCGISQPTLDKQLKGLRGISIETVSGILFAFPQISAEWLLRGSGEMLKGQPEDQYAERLMKLVDTIATLQDTINIKSETISTLTAKIKELETQLKNK